MLQGARDISIKKVFSTVAPYIDSLSTIFSFGLSHLWRRKVVSLSDIKGDENVLDICTGTGEMALLLGNRIKTEGRVTGVDFCEDMIRLADKKIKPEQKNISFIVSDAKKLDFEDNIFDVVTAAFGMRNIPDTAAALQEIKRVLKPGGKFFCLELTRPAKKWFLLIYKIYLFKIIPFFGRIITKSDAPYKYLPTSINAFYPPEEFMRIIEESGFTGLTVHSMTMGVVTIFGAVKK